MRVKTFAGSITTAFTPGNGTFALSGSATLTETDSGGNVTTDNTVDISFSPTTLVCGGTPPCTSGAVISALGQAGPSNFSVFSLGGNIQFSAGTVQGNIGVSGSGHYNQSGSTTVTGALFLSSQASAQTSGSAQIQGGIQKNQDALLNQAVSDALSASSFFAGSAPTTSVPGNMINLAGGGTLTITGGAGTNVLDVTKINLSGGSKLILSAPAGAQFIVNNSGQLQLSGSSQIQLQGGLTPYDVVFNQTGNQQVIFSGGSAVTGIVLAPFASANPDAGTLTGEVIAAPKGQVINIASGEVILHPEVCPQ